MKNIIREVKKHYCLVRVKGYFLINFIKSLTKTNIEVKNINYIDENELHIKILIKDFKKLKKEFKHYKFKKIKEIGLYTIKPFLKKNKIILFGILIGLGIIFTLSRVLVNVEVIHSKKEIRDLVRKELETHGIKKLRFKKSYQSIQKIKHEILEKYPDRLEWLEIEVSGMNYKVRIEERIITVPKEEKESCHIVATKDAVITKIVAYSGLTMKKIDNYVKKDDIIISGIITLNEAVKGTVCAKGIVHGETWYTVGVSVPMHYEERIETGKKRYNLVYETKKSKNTVFRPRFKKFNKEHKTILDLFGFKMYLQIEREYRSLPRIYTEIQAVEKGMELAREKLYLNLDKEAVILSQKVLKKVLNDGTMDLEIFFAVNELISRTSEFTYVPEVAEE